MTWSIGGSLLPASFPIAALYAGLAIAGCDQLRGPRLKSAAAGPQGAAGCRSQGDQGERGELGARRPAVPKAIRERKEEPGARGASGPRGDHGERFGERRRGAVQLERAAGVDVRLCMRAWMKRWICRRTALQRMTDQRWALCLEEYAAGEGESRRCDGRKDGNVGGKSNGWRARWRWPRWLLSSA